MKLLLHCLCLFCLSLLVHVSGASALTIRIEPTSINLGAPRTTFSVSVVIQDVVDLGSFQFRVDYSPATVSIADKSQISLGGFLASTGRTAVALDPIIDNVAGKATFGAFSFGAVPGPNASGSSPGLLATITFTVQSQTTGLLALTSAETTDTHATAITVDVFGNCTLVTVPDAPTGVAATAGNTEATVSFAAPASNGGSPITSYTVTSSPGGIAKTGASSPIIVTGLNNGTTYTFTVAATNVAGTSLASSPSNSVTPTAPATLTLDSPNGGQAWYAGSTQLIEWTYSGQAGEKVKINLLKANKIVKTLAKAASIGKGGKGSFKWAIPTTQTPGDDYKIKVISTTNSSCNDASDTVFTIKPPQPITVLSPNGGENWKVGSAHTINWKYTVDIGATIKVELLSGESVVRVISSSAACGISGTGSLPWTVPRGQAYGSEYRIRVTSNTNVSHTDTSDKTFTISGPTLDITAPDGGESWQKGSRQTITWTYTGNPGGKVKIQLLKAGMAVRTLASGTSIGSDGNGSFPWTIPSNLSAASNYQVKLTHTAISGCTATSGGNFSITKAVLAASAGPDQKVAPSEQVRLSAANSTGLNKNSVSYLWTQLDGPQTMLSNPAAEEPSFMAPEVGEGDKFLSFQVIVTGQDGAQSQDFCIVNVTDGNTPPIADAGPAQAVVGGQLVTMDGSRSFDFDDGIAGYSWRQIAGTEVILCSPTSAQPTFTAPDVELLSEALIFELTVTDEGGLRARNRCVVNVTTVRNPPIADAGPDLVVSPGAEVTLDGSKSTDVDGGILSYRWTQLSGQPVRLSSPVAVQPRFIAPPPAGKSQELVFQVLVTDSAGLQDKAEVVVEVRRTQE